MRFFTASSAVVRASSSIKSEYSARLVQIFWPVITYSSPSLSARVWMRVVSDPAVGSVTPNACSRRPPFCQRRQPPFPLLRRAVPYQRAHNIHLRVADARVPAAAIHLLQDHRRLSNRRAPAPILLRDQRRQRSPPPSSPPQTQPDNPAPHPAAANRAPETGHRVGGRRAVIRGTFLLCRFQSLVVTSLPFRCCVVAVRLCPAANTPVNSQRQS